MSVNRQCKYCNKVMKGKQPLIVGGVCYNCYKKLLVVRKLLKLTEPLREIADQRFIDNFELRVDWNLPVTPAEVERYERIIKERKNER